MKVATIRLPKDPFKSFIVHTEIDPFTTWHHHPEYELVYIMNGKGRRLVGDHVARFDREDLILLGPYLPHQWICDSISDDELNTINNQALVIQFTDNFMGNTFFELPETSGLKKLLGKSSRGIEFFGKTKSQIISILRSMNDMSDSKRFYALLRIYEVIESSADYNYLASPNSINNFSSKENEPMQLAMKYIFQNFQNKIQIEELLEVTSKSYAAFYPAFKKTFLMSFTDYLLNVRVGYACKLLSDGTLNINEIAYDSGFENISNFNRQFKRIKKLTPRDFQKQYNHNIAQPNSKVD